MEHRDIIVVGGSAGGVDVLIHLVSELPADFDASLFVVIHLSRTHISRLPEILGARGLLEATHPADGDPVQKGVLYLAPPDRHLLLASDTVRVTHGPPENGYRPSVDLLFRAAARTFGRRVIAVVLSGALDDGSAGTQAVVEAGGTVVVQDPEGALYPDMPRNAIAATDVHHVVPTTDLASTLIRLVAEPIEPEETTTLERPQDP